MRGPSTTKLLVTSAAVLLGLGVVTLAVQLDFLEPVFMTGVLLLGAPFFAAASIAVFQRMVGQPLMVPSMPAKPAFDPDARRSSPRPTVRTQRTIRAPGRGRRRYDVSTRLPY